jgi:hypothetical protein
MIQQDAEQRRIRFSQRQQLAGGRTVLAGADSYRS